MATMTATVRPGMTTGLLLAGAVGILALPSAVLAFSTRFDPAPTGLHGDSGGATRSGSQMAEARSLAAGRPFHFTPAGTPNSPDRLLTVAVRVDPQVVRDIIVRARPQEGDASAAAQRSAVIQLAPTAFNLGVARGYQSFAAKEPLPDSLRKNEMPDLAAFAPSQDQRGASSRFSPRITLDERQITGRAPRTFGGEGDDRVDLGGSLRVTRNLDVTAGVRYSAADRDRLQPLTDGKRDDQAVYVGTQFRF